MRYWNGHQWKEHVEPMRFDASKSLGKEPNTCTVELLNAAAATDVPFVPAAGNEPFCIDCGAITSDECECDSVAVRTHELSDDELEKLTAPAVH